MARRSGSGGSHFGGSSSPRGASGSGGSHFGGSSSSRGVGRSSHSSGSRSSVHIRIGGGHYHHGPHYGGASAPGWVACIIVAIFIALFCLPFFLMAEEADRAIKIIEDDFFYYHDMVQYANIHPEYQVDGKITGRFKNVDLNKWYIEYTIEGAIDEYTTYSIYSDEEITKYRHGDTIRVAVDSIPVTNDTDSMVMDFANYSINDDAEYEILKSQKTKYTTIATIILVASSLLIVIGVVSAIKAGKKSVEGSSNTSKTSAESATNDKKGKYCPYCGCKADDSRSKCEHCGANLR